MNNRNSVFSFRSPLLNFYLLRRIFSTSSTPSASLCLLLAGLLKLALISTCLFSVSLAFPFFSFCEAFLKLPSVAFDLSSSCCTKDVTIRPSFYYCSSNLFAASSSSSPTKKRENYNSFTRRDRLKLQYQENQNDNYNNNDNNDNKKNQENENNNSDEDNVFYSENNFFRLQRFQSSDFEMQRFLGESRINVLEVQEQFIDTTFTPPTPNPNSPNLPASKNKDNSNNKNNIKNNGREDDRGSGIGNRRDGNVKNKIGKDVDVKQYTDRERMESYRSTASLGVAIRLFEGTNTKTGEKVIIKEYLPQASVLCNDELRAYQHVYSRVEMDYFKKLNSKRERNSVSDNNNDNNNILDKDDDNTNNIKNSFLPQLQIPKFTENLDGDDEEYKDDDSFNRFPSFTFSKTDFASYPPPSTAIPFSNSSPSLELPVLPLLGTINMLSRPQNLNVNPDQYKDKDNENNRPPAVDGIVNFYTEAEYVNYDYRTSDPSVFMNKNFLSQWDTMFPNLTPPDPESKFLVYRPLNGYPLSILKQLLLPPTLLSSNIKKRDSMMTQRQTSTNKKEDDDEYGLILSFFSKLNNQFGNGNGDNKKSSFDLEYMMNPGKRVEDATNYVRSLFYQSLVAMQLLHNTGLIHASFGPSSLFVNTVDIRKYEKLKVIYTDIGLSISTVKENVPSRCSLAELKGNDLTSLGYSLLEFTLNYFLEDDVEEDDEDEDDEEYNDEEQGGGGVSNQERQSTLASISEDNSYRDALVESNVDINSQNYMKTYNQNVGNNNNEKNKKKNNLISPEEYLNDELYQQEISGYNDDDDDDDEEEVEEQDDSIDPQRLQAIIEDYCQKDVQGLFRLYVSKNKRWQGAITFLDQNNKSGWKLLHALIHGQTSLIPNYIDPYDSIDLIQPLLEIYSDFLLVQKKGM